MESEDQNRHQFHERLSSWIEACSAALAKRTDETIEIVETASHQNVEQAKVLYLLGRSCYYSGQSALLLLSRLLIWDAEVVNRSLMEGTVKFCYLASGDSDSVLRKLEEFEVILPGISDKRRRGRLLDFLQIVENPNSEEWARFHDVLELEDRAKDKLAELTRSERKRISQQWSFYEMTHSLGASGDDLFKDLPHLLFGYGMASHLAHMDADGVTMAHQRDLMEPVVRDQIYMAHAGRLISDLLTLAYIRHVVAARRFAKVTEPIDATFESLGWLQKEISQIENG